MATTDTMGIPPNGTDRYNFNVVVFINKRRHFKLLCATALPALIVIVQNIINLHQDVKTLRANHLVAENVQFSVEIGKILHEIQTECGTAAFFVSTDGDTHYKDRLMGQFIETDSSVLNLSKWLPIDNNKVQLKSRDEFIDFLWDFRSGLLKHNVNLTEMINFYSNVNYMLESVVVTSINMEVAYTYWSELIAYEMLLFSSGFAGIERTLGGTYYTRGLMPLGDYIWYIENRVLADEFLAQTMLYSAFAEDMMSKLYTGSNLANNIERMRREIASNVAQNASLEMGNEWFNNMTTLIDILKTVQDGLADNIKKHVKHENDAVKETLAARSIQLVIAISMLPIVTVLVRSIIRVSTKLKSRTADLEEKKREADRLVEALEDERKRTEELLHQVLPKSIAKTLIEKGHVIPEAFESATIMFTDVVDFTKISSRCTPMEVISMLNELYVTMDEKLEQFGVYKVETIGDAYMVASGLPNRNGDYHVQEIAKLSLELRNALTKMTIPHEQNKTIRLRIGFNSGPCVAGVVGHKMPKYCVFGDTVNTASRMESTSLPLKIQITESSACLLGLANGFVFCERGYIEVKGKGQMRTFWLESYQSTTTST